MTHVHIVTQRERKATSSSPRFVVLRERRFQKVSRAYSGCPKPEVMRQIRVNSRRFLTAAST